MESPDRKPNMASCPYGFPARREPAAKISTLRVSLFTHELRIGFQKYCCRQ